MTLQPPEAVLLDQGNTYRCGPYSDLEWWAAAGFEQQCRDTLAWSNIIRAADQQQGTSFGQVHGLVTDWELALNVPIRWFQDGYIRDFETLKQLVRDGWCVVVGVYEHDLVDPAHPEYGPQRYFHYIAIDDLLEGEESSYGVDVYKVKDPFHIYDHEDGVVAVDDMETAIRHNWDPVIIGIAWRFDAA